MIFIFVFNSFQLCLMLNIRQTVFYCHCLILYSVYYDIVFFCGSAVLEELVNIGRLKGSVVGGRQDKAVYIPDIYTKTQNAWVDSFLQQNGYLGRCC